MVLQHAVRRTLLLCVTGALLPGCSHLNHSQDGTLIGTGVGTVAGAVIGHQSGRPGLGALVGAVAGGVGGGLIGNARDVREERDAAVSYAGYVERRRLADLRAVTNRDVVELSLSGAGEQVIIGHIRDRGGRFDLSTEAIVQLKQDGVSDAVIEAMQQNNTSRIVERRSTAYDGSADIELFSGRRR